MSVKETEKLIEEIEEIKNLVLQLKTDIFSINNRVEALIRFAFTKEKLTVDDFILAMVDYVNWRSAVLETLEKKTIVEKVKKALEYNDVNSSKILADDLGLLPLIEAAGGTSAKTVSLILSLPHSNFLAQALSPYQDSYKEETN